MVCLGAGKGVSRSLIYNQQVVGGCNCHIKGKMPVTSICSPVCSSFFKKGEDEGPAILVKGQER